MPDDLPEIYGVCRGHGCSFIWTVEPTIAGVGDEPECPECGRAGWPMSPKEAGARHTVPRGPFWGLTCPKCKNGKLRVCRSCYEEERENALVNPSSYVCANPDCGEHMTPMQEGGLRDAMLKRDQGA